jgi:hypothetical protein
LEARDSQRNNSIVDIIHCEWGTVTLYSPLLHILKKSLLSTWCRLLHSKLIFCALTGSMKCFIHRLRAPAFVTLHCLLFLSSLCVCSASHLIVKVFLCMCKATFKCRPINPYCHPSVHGLQGRWSCLCMVSVVYIWSMYGLCRVCLLLKVTRLEITRNLSHASGT